MTTSRAGRSPVVCGIDIGSTNTKVVALDPHGAVVGRQSRPTPRTDDCVDASALVRAVEDMIAAVCAQRYRAHAVCAAGVGEDGVLVDAALAPLTPALAWFDPRRAAVFAELAPRLGRPADVCTVDDAARSLVGWRWAVGRPGAERAEAWVALADFASTIWAGTPFISDTLAARTAAWSNVTRGWIGDRVAMTLGSAALLPGVLRAGDVVGAMRSDRLSRAGVLHGDAVVVAGGHDHPIGGWGVQLVAPWCLLDSMGTAEIVVAQTPSTDLRCTDDVDIAPGILTPGTTVLRVEELARNVAWASRDGAVHRHLAALLAGDEPPDAFLHEPVFVPGGRGGGAPRFTADAPASPHSRASAVIGALARLGGQAAAAVAAHLPADPDIYAAGGWSRSPGWIAAKEAVTGRSVAVIPEPQVTATGAALLAATALDWSPSASLALGMVAGRGGPPPDRAGLLRPHRGQHQGVDHLAHERRVDALPADDPHQPHRGQHVGDQ
jgi:sugar (pentulose or hexulose) kinase